ncbi:SusC/RagA family TonB-linked outer membrane protein [Capnocytophaga ochracea]|uniref:TonB-dependent receptor n=1 Tax=Capnocytophaga ochracea TaxID=1018 RepID=A0AA46W6K7_CAPOC|nr:TonB-dependent receptor [Capnocytophaga ochracea]UZD39933.1 TonB-dependent receptor [Capnocytophaga ochracea]
MKGKQRTLLNSIGKLALLLLFSLLATALSAQNKKISGKVIDEKHQPVLGASVVVKGTTKGTTTDFDGNFTIDVPAKATLSVSFIGYHTQNVAVGNQNQLTIVLKEEQEQLDEVVVVGYGTVRKKDLTGAVTSVSNKALKEKPIANAGEALQGRAAGVQVTSAGKPGDNVSFRIRGISTINNSEPLLVIDGVPTDLGINALNVDDIENIDVLKDASATAIYGSRGANGVVLITTKKGKNGDGKLSFSTNVALQQATNLPVMLNAREFASFHNEMIANYNRTPGVSPLTQRPDFANPEDWGEGTNWLKALFRPAFMRNYSLSYSGGNDKSNYYVSAGVFDQDGIILNTSYRRYTVQFNGESRVKPWIKFGNNLTLSHDEKKSGDYNIRMAMASLPTQPIYNEDGSYSGPDSPAHQYSDIRNVIGTALINGQNTTKGYNILGNIFAEITPVKHLVLKTTGGLDFKYWDNRSFSPKYNWKPIPNPLSNLYQDANKSTTLLWDNTLTYTNTFAQKHFLNVMVGTSAQNNVYSKINASVSNFLSDQQNQLSKGLENPTVGGTMNDWAILSFIGRLNYTYADKYLLTATVRRDGSSRFSKENRWGTFPSFSLAWRASNESFFPKNDYVNDVKLRVGYGMTGNQGGIDNYAYFTKLRTGQYVFNNNLVSTLYPHVMPNPNVKWETVEQFNGGIDLALLKNRLNLTFDAYIKNTSDMLVPMAVSVSSGYSDINVPSINAGKVENKGVELTVSSVNVNKKDFQWNTDVNVSFNRNKIVKMNDGVPLFTGFEAFLTKLQILSEGHPVNSFYGYVMNGLFQNQAEVDNYATQVENGTAPGDVKFRDLNNDGVINAEDRTYIGNPFPEWTFSMNNNFNYKNIDLQIFLQGVAGNDIYNANRIWQEGMSVPQNQIAKVKDRWTGEGTSNSIPRAIYGDPNQNARHSTRFVEDGSYLRIKNVTLGYTLPKEVTQKFHTDMLRIYLSCQNLYTFTKYSGMDPEVGTGGVDSGTYPVTRTVSFGLNVQF